MIISSILYMLGFSMTYFGFAETEEEHAPDDPFVNAVFSFAWPVIAAGMLCYMIYKTFKK